MSSKSTPKGGKPRRDGSTAKPQLVDPKTGRKYKDTLDNRRKLGLLPTDAEKVTGKPGQTAPVGPTEPVAGPTGLESEQSVRDRLAGSGGHADVVPGAVPAAPELEPIDYAELVGVVNILLSAKWPNAKMTDAEQRAIGKALDAVIAKYWPSLKTAGPEFALTVAVMSYVTRAFLGPMLSGAGLPVDVGGH